MGIQIFDSGTGLPIFKSSTLPDQVGLNDTPANAFVRNGVAGNCIEYTGNSTFYNMGKAIYTQVKETDRSHSGADVVRQGKTPIACVVDLDHNDPSYFGGSSITYGVHSVVYAGRNSNNYGTGKAFTSVVQVSKDPSKSCEHNNLFMQYLMGTASNPVSSRGWGIDAGMHLGTIQPTLAVGISYVTTNHYNGSPSAGPAAAIVIQSLGGVDGNGGQAFGGGTSYPWGIGLLSTGFSTGGTLDGYDPAIQVGGTCSAWNLAAGYTGDMINGQCGRAVLVKKKPSGISVARLGAFISEGTGEAGGVIFGADVNDANRVSVYRPANGVLALNGKLNLSGAASSTTATPANVVFKVPLHDASGTLIGYLPVYGSL